MEVLKADGHQLMRGGGENLLRFRDVRDDQIGEYSHGDSFELLPFGYVPAQPEGLGGGGGKA